MQRITIQSTGKNASLEIERRDYDYAISAFLRGEFVRNESVSFIDTVDFIQALRVFERTRSGCVRLKSTEDCWIMVEADGHMGHAWITFQVTRHLYEFSPQTNDNRSGRILLSGSFPLSGEFIAQTVYDFTRLFAEPEHNAGCD